MPDKSIILMVGLEVGVAFLFLLGLVTLRAQGLRKTAQALEAKVLELRQLLKNVRAELKVTREEVKAQPPIPDYAEVIDAQINITRNHHLELNAERDIVLDMAADTPLARRAVSLRHAFLIAEKEAWLASDNGRDVDWGVLENKFTQIIQFYEQPAAGAEESVIADADSLEALDLDGEVPQNGEAAALQAVIDNQKRHIENLERFKKLFFDADEKWHKANRQAEEYRQALAEHGSKLEGGAEFNGLLEKYNQVYVEFGAALAKDKDPSRVDSESTAKPGAEQPSVGRMVIANQEELQRLRNMAVDQHKMIQHLRDELESATSVEAKDRVISELHKQLERHERFLKESDLCTKQLESELDRSLEENHTLKMKVLQIKQDPSSLVDGEVEQMTNIIEDFTRQSAEMLNALEMLEAECSELRARLAEGEGENAAAPVEQLKQQLATAQQELLNLQTQHIELEERYLELKLAAL
ncbi:MAG: hypothetical protein JWM78_2558 [Verrucomicrobiaceae bacterium]|nr:hypothetical protein [Verrucomicrobiaceae bacterium]